MSMYNTRGWYLCVGKGGGRGGGGGGRGGGSIAGGGEETEDCCLTKMSCGVHSHLNLRLCGRLLCKPGHMIDNGCKVGWSPELDGAQGSVVRLHHTRDAHTVGVLGVAIESKLMGHPATNVATKAESWKQFVSEGSRAAPITEVKNWGRW